MLLPLILNTTSPFGTYFEPDATVAFKSIVSVLLAVIELIAICVESSLLLVFILLVVFWILFELSALLSSSESVEVTLVTLFELVVPAEDDAELVVITVFVLLSVFVVEWVA